jgi:hypothetical protein
VSGGCGSDITGPVKQPGQTTGRNHHIGETAAQAGAAPSGTAAVARSRPGAVPQRPGQRIGHCRVGAPTLHRPPGEDSESSGGPPGDHPGHQPGLADPRLTGHQQRCPIVAAYGVNQPPHSGQLSISPHQCRAAAGAAVSRSHGDERARAVHRNDYRHLTASPTRANTLARHRGANACARG